ncbi:siphovirus Gp157 family protein [Lactobacillus gallinarum]|uniref:Siphovirus Gp157 family protein n=1 Tax=Lactobacillus gallinarum TaxID=52242 RepID=A0A1Y4VZI7_9LACO|nr:siphovirus Gp157 family protein [Lactobacillus gallinarum]OUQ01998.1 hypothetical protein B5E95_00430 [Lactobacillus gallinarum]OUQ58243.1 hypothetical protein B5E59_00560 [Lactobacillus gallinarum]OUQ75527.1 hypothetical protein B5E44_07125 [Lactobacillus gallinarum]
MNLFEINASIEKIKEKMDNGDLDPAVLIDTLDSLEATRDDKLDGLAGWYDSNKATQDFLTEKIKTLSKEKKRLENLNTRIMSYMTDTIDASGAKQIKTTNHILKPRNYRASTYIDDEALIPKDFKKTETVEKIDKKLIYADLTAGKLVPGAHLEPNRKTTIM